MCVNVVRGELKRKNKVLTKETKIQKKKIVDSGIGKKTFLKKHKMQILKKISLNHDLKLLYDTLK